MSLIYLYAAHMIGYWGSVAVCTRLYPRNVTVFALWCALEVIKNQVLFTPLIAGPLFCMIFSGFQLPLLWHIYSALTLKVYQSCIGSLW